MTSSSAALSSRSTARSRPALTEHGQLGGPSGGRVASVRALPERVLDHGGQAPARPRRDLLGLGEQGVIEIDRRPHRHADHP
jgi:hypothetical protein